MNSKIDDMNNCNKTEGKNSPRQYVIALIAILLLSYLVRLSFPSFSSMYDTILFASSSKQASAEVVDVRQGINDDLAMLLPSGELLLLGADFYRPIVRVEGGAGSDAPIELSQASSHAYSIGERISVMVDSAHADEPVRLTTTSWYWNAALIRLLLLLAVMLIVVTMWRLLHLRVRRYAESASRARYHKASSTVSTSAVN